MDTKGSKHRLKQKELVMNIFFLFERKYEQSDVESIWMIKLPIEEIKSELEEICSVHYRSNLWIYTQLRRYEEDLGVRLFRKDNTGRKKGSFFLSISENMVEFNQKQHLYVSDKIKVANGTFDKIINEAKLKNAGEVRIFLGAGSTIFHLANILAERASQYPLKFCVYTHNLGVLKRLLEAGVDMKNIDVFTVKGQIDPITYTILGRLDESDTTIPYDYVVMGTSYINNELLYVESRKETGLKDLILHQMQGKKILVLTKHEFIDQPIEGLPAYGSIRDFDSVVVPVHSNADNPKKMHELAFEQYRHLFEPEIIHWNYMILKVRKSAPETRRQQAG
jgi:DeoR/GlpR family transcriptional regulator of sugar metabolism